MDRLVQLGKPIAILAFLLVVGLGCHSVPAEAPPLFPASGVANYEGLVSARWVKALLDFQEGEAGAQRPPTYTNHHYVVLEASWGEVKKAKGYLRGHLPGAIHINTDDVENGYPQWRLRPDAELHRVIGQHGVTPQTTVVVYSDQMIAAARIWWVLKYAGVNDVRLLDGGVRGWKESGYPVETTIRIPMPVPFDSVVKSNFLATTKYVRDNLENPETLLVDTRSSAEFNGKKSGYKYLDCSGRIPTAMAIGNVDDGSSDYVRSGGRLLDPREIEKRWREMGMGFDRGSSSSEREVVFYCGGGWRSSLAFYYAWLLGYESIRNYSDGWSGWSTVYTPDPTAGGSTPGWKQSRTSNAIVERGD